MRHSEFDAILYDQNKSVWLGFKNPVKQFCVSKQKDILPALSEIEELCEKNHCFAVGYLAYEAAPAFDKNLNCLEFNDYDLLNFYIFSDHVDFKALEIPSHPIFLRDWYSSVTQDEYMNSISSIKTSIADGYTYQVNYTFRLYNHFSGDPYSLFYSMVQSQAPGYSALLRFADITICSASPELFFTKQGSMLTCKPMKGTIKRGNSLLEDKQLKKELRDSIKDQAENIMIVDMTRNDLGRISKTGSVKVSNLFDIQKYPTVWQMTTTVRSESDQSTANIFKALFPCASITGAPKISTMGIISNLETTPRGIYTGSIGMITPERNCQFNVAIRTAVIDNNSRTLTYGVGGGIVWDSSDQGEYQEALLKAEVILKTNPTFELKESILWEPNSGYFLLEEHLNRLFSSAELFDFSYDKNNIITALNQLAASLGSQKAHKIKILLSKLGNITISSLQISKEPTLCTKLRFAENSVLSNDRTIFHKTTLRDSYIDTNRDPLVEDFLYWNDKGQVTETSIANIAIKINKKLYTPPISCGLLPGTYREHLIKSGFLHERIIWKDELDQDSELYLLNSVRKLWQAKLILPK